MPTKADVRLQKIEGQLAQAGWSEKQGNLIKEWLLRSISKGNQVLEIPVVYASGDEPVDYLLMGHDKKPIGIVMANRDISDPLEGKRQAEEYAEHIFSLYNIQPFIFLTNSESIVFYDRGRDYPPRKISGFFRLEDLEQFTFQRKYSQPLSEVPLNLVIAGGEKRRYQRPRLGLLQRTWSSANESFCW